MEDSSESLWSFKPRERPAKPWDGWELVKERRIGKGAFSAVYLVRDEASGLHMALKKIDKIHIFNEVRKNQFLREIKIHRILSHPSIVQFVDCFDTDDHVCILMEYCNSGTLDDFMDRRPSGSPEHLVKRLVRQVLAGIEYLHDHQIIHRDLKPSNIFMTVDPRDKVHLKLGDFGFCRIGEEEDSPLLCGTPNYMAPEVISEGRYLMVSDIWAIGVLIYGLLVGKPPFQGPTRDDTMENVLSRPVILPSAVSDTAADLLRHCLAKDYRYRCTAREALVHPFFT
jgi:serine/threonine protein kinase